MDCSTTKEEKLQILETHAGTLLREPFIWDMVRDQYFEVTTEHLMQILRRWSESQLSALVDEFAPRKEDGYV